MNARKLFVRTAVDGLLAAQPFAKKADIARALNWDRRNLAVYYTRGNYRVVEGPELLRVKRQFFKNHTSKFRRWLDSCSAPSA